MANQMDSASLNELLEEINATVSKTYAKVSDIHRIIVGGQGGNDSRNLLVSDARSLSTAE